MKKIIFILVIIFIFSCKKNTEDKVSNRDSIVTSIDSDSINIDSSKIKKVEKEVFEEEQKDRNYSQTINHKNISAEIFYTIKNSRVDYYKLKIDQGKKVQNIETVSNWEFDNVEQLEFQFQDVNFDGIKDITISKEVGMNWFTLNVWICKDGKFVKENKFDKIYNPIFDLQKKEINSDYRISGIGEFWSIYKWKNDKLIRISYTEDVMNRN